MNPTGRVADHRQWPAAALLIGALIVAGFMYQPGASGSLHFDDPHNLAGLTQVVDPPSAAGFVAGGQAGPLGRPLALASFALQAYAWPDSPEVFLQTNIHLHLLNGVLVVWVLYLVTTAIGHSPRQAAWIASMSGAIWMLLPILASSSLMIVQRMTTMSAMFVLVGLIGYLYSRTLLTCRPRVALLLMSMCTVLGTTLAILAKENGVLLLLFVLVLETTVLSPTHRPGAAVLWRTWCAIFLVVPAAALLVYLAVNLQYNEAALLRRGFSGSDRLLTQAQVLWQYLYHAFLPTTPSLGPFHDNQVIYRDWLHPLSALAVLGWLTVGAAAVTLRRRVPLFSFAVGWYVVGHALESTTIPLELYFEHRNYLPLIGPVFSLVAALALLAPRWQPIVRASLLAYSFVLSLVLLSTTSLWGRPALAAEMWAIYNPDSKRAIQYLAGQLQRNGDYHTARRMLTGFIDEHATSGAMDLQIFGISCLLEPESPQTEQIGHLEKRLKTADFEYGVFESLQHLYRMASDNVCVGVDRTTVYTLASIAASNPSFQSEPTVHHNLHILMAEEAFAQRDLDLTMHHIESALSARYTFTTLIFTVQTLTSAGLHSVAEDFVQDAYSHKPKHPIQALLWRQRIANLEHATSSVATP